MTMSINKVAAGTQLKPFRIEHVDPEWMKTWAVALHDPNPIHLDPEAVKAAGLGDRVINQGPANLAYIINMVKIALPGAFIADIEMRYVDNVFGGDAVEAGGTVTDVVSEGGSQRVTCDVWLKADARDFVLKGTMIVRLPA